MELHEALYTTRAMRRVKPDPIPADVQAKILDAAIRAPTGGNAQDWRFLLVDDPALRAQLGPLYRGALDTLWKTFYAERIAAMDADSDSPASIEMRKVLRSAQWLADNFETVPLWLFAFVRMDPTGGSIFPAVWSAQLAARGEGVGSALTTVMGFFARDQVLEALAVPDEGWMLACAVSFGYPTGKWGTAARRPVHEVSYRNQWGADVGLQIDRPLWP